MDDIAPEYDVVVLGTGKLHPHSQPQPRIEGQLQLFHCLQHCGSGELLTIIL